MKYSAIAIITVMSLQCFGEALSIGSAPMLRDDQGIAVDAGLTLGDITAFGGRINVPVGNDVVLFAGLADVEFDDTDESDMAYGGGILFKLPEIDAPVRLGLKASYYMWETSFGGGDIELTELALRLVALGEVDGVDNLLWFGEIGYHMLETEIGSASDDSNELGLELGLIYDLSDDFSLFGSFEIVDDTWFNLGVRFSFDD